MVWFQVFCRYLRCLVDQFEALVVLLRRLVSPLLSFAVFQSFAVFSWTGVIV